MSNRKIKLKSGRLTRPDYSTIRRGRGTRATLRIPSPRGNELCRFRNLANSRFLPAFIRGAEKLIKMLLEQAEPPPLHCRRM